MKKHQTRHNAFSLIELSIVLLIIGIIIAGITQGSRLINAFKLSSARTTTQSSPVPSILNLSFWFEATNEKSFKNQTGSQDISDNDTVQYWYDINPISQKGYFAYQATTAYQPTYVTNGINGLPSVRFTATNNNMRLIATIGSQIKVDTTVFLVFNWTATNSTVNVSEIFGIPDSANGSLGVAGGRSSTWTVASGGTGTYYFYDGASQIDNLTYSLTKAKPMILSRVYNPAANSAKLYANGTQVSSTTAGGTNIGYLASIEIGNDGTVARTFGGDFGEIIIYERALKTEERQSVEQYLSKKWNIKLN